LQTPHRFRTKRQLWAYSGFAVETYDSGEYRFVRGKLQRNRARITLRGLNHNHNHDLKNLLKGAAITAIERNSRKFLIPNSFVRSNMLQSSVFK
jgi:hypothetical protein